MKKALLIFSLLVLSQFAYASHFVFAPSVTYMSREAENNGTQIADTGLTVMDFKLGYIFDMGLYLGGLYSLIQDDILSSGSSDFHFGPSVGYYNSGFFVAGTYYLFAERDFDTGNTKLADVSGYQIDISYTLPINQLVSIGPQITYHNVEYKDAQVGGLSSPTDYKWKGFTPYIALLFMF